MAKSFIRRKQQTADEIAAEHAQEQQLANFAGIPAWPPENSAVWIVVLQRAGFGQQEINQFLAHTGDDRHADAGELHRRYIGGLVSDGDFPCFSVQLREGLERYHREKNGATAGAITRSRNFDRDVWMYGQRELGKTLCEIRTALRDEQSEWDQLETDEAVRMALSRFCKKQRLPPIHHRN